MSDQSADGTGRCDLCGRPAVVERWSKQACKHHADQLNYEVAVFERSFQAQHYLNIGLLVAITAFLIVVFVL